MLFLHSKGLYTPDAFNSVRLNYSRTPPLMQPFTPTAYFHWTNLRHLFFPNQARFFAVLQIQINRSDWSDRFILQQVRWEFKLRTSSEYTIVSQWLKMKIHWLKNTIFTADIQLACSGSVGSLKWFVCPWDPIRCSFCFCLFVFFKQCILCENHWILQGRY